MLCSLGAPPSRLPTLSGIRVLWRADVRADATDADCVCSKLVDKWNKDQNTLDSASRNQWYKMGYELRGATVELDGAAYAWTCVAEVKLNVLKALSHETASEEASHACVLCWHLSDGHSCSLS